MTTKEAVALLERYSNYDGMGITNLAGCKEAMRVAVDTLKEACPELRESEDERIRRTLAEYFGPKVQLDFVRGIPIQKIRAWLEKQKEKEKYGRMMPVYDNLDSFESALAKAWRAYNDSGARTVDGCEDDYVECAHAKGFREGYLFGLGKYKDLDKMIVISPEVWDNAISDAYENGKKDGEKQKEPHYTKRNALFDKCVENCDPEVMKEVSDKVDEMLEKEQKPISQEDFDAAKHEALWGEQKPAECGVKGRRGRIGSTPEHIRKKAENFLSKMEPPYDADDICSAYETGAMENANHSWSEEDEKAINDLMWCITAYRENAFNELHIKRANNAENFLKSLRPSWKPSKEQDYSGLSDLERAIHRGFLCAGVENVPVIIIKETAQDCIASLRHYWRPSEEQMETLKKALYINPASGKLHELKENEVCILQSLLRELEKL